MSCELYLHGYSHSTLPSAEMMATLPFILRQNAMANRLGSRHKLDQNERKQCELKTHDSSEYGIEAVGFSGRQSQSRPLTDETSFSFQVTPTSRQPSSE